MFKIKEEHLNFEKHMVLGYITSLTPGGHGYSPGCGYYGRNGASETETHGFGGISFALKHINKVGELPTFVEVNGNRSMASHWFEAC